MQRLEVSGAVRLIYRSLGVKGLNKPEFSRRIISINFKKILRKSHQWKPSCSTQTDGQA